MSAKRHRNKRRGRGGERDEKIQPLPSVVPVRRCPVAGQADAIQDSGCQKRGVQAVSAEAPASGPRVGTRAPCGAWSRHNREQFHCTARTTRQDACAVRWNGTDLSLDHRFAPFPSIRFARFDISRTYPSWSGVCERVAGRSRKETSNEIGITLASSNSIVTNANCWRLSLSRFNFVDHTRDDLSLGCNTDVIVENVPSSSSSSFFFFLLSFRLVFDTVGRNRRLALDRPWTLSSWIASIADWTRSEEQTPYTRDVHSVWARGNDWSPIERRRSSTWPRRPPPDSRGAASRPPDARTALPTTPFNHRCPYKPFDTFDFCHPLTPAVPRFLSLSSHCLSFFNAFAVDSRRESGRTGVQYSTPIWPILSTGSQTFERGSFVARVQTVSLKFHR